MCKEIRRQFDDWGVGPADLVVCGGARGTDLLCAEEALRRGASVKLCLALPIAEFVARSVEVPGTDWVTRFWAVEAQSETFEQAPPPPGKNVFEAANEWMIDVGRAAATASGGELFALIVWDGNVSDGSGGAGDFGERAARAHIPVAGIDPTPSPSADRQWRDGPKKLLALDGGGIRGVVTLAILKQIEAQLRAWSGREELVLADYFDYIGGTSTGAIIATALSLGHSVDEVLDRYRTLGKRVFRFNWLAPFASLHPSGPITEELNALIGRDRPLGDPALRTLLLLVLHNSDTDSPWPLSNSRSARYNRPERRLGVHPERGVEWTPDRNLDLSLSMLVRGSTAAPLYFAPQDINVGARTVRFQDGGVTPYNNPALLMYSMATQKEYNVRWPDGADNMLVVSVGTGLAAAEQTKRWTWLSRVKSLPAVFMNGSSIGQDYLCRVVGTTAAGFQIDREVGQIPHGLGRFTYARYNVDIGDLNELARELKARGTTAEELQRLEQIAEIPRRKLVKLDSADRIDDLYLLGELASRLVDVPTHFAAFPP